MNDWTKRAPLISTVRKSEEITNAEDNQQRVSISPSLWNKRCVNYVVLLEESDERNCYICLNALNIINGALKFQNIRIFCNAKTLLIKFPRRLFRPSRVETSTSQRNERRSDKKLKWSVACVKTWNTLANTTCARARKFQLQNASSFIDCNAGYYSPRPRLLSGGENYQVFSSPYFSIPSGCFYVKTV